MPGYNQDREFEKTCLDRLADAFGDLAQAKRSYHANAFPDIVINGFGVEVKFTRRDSWFGTGNSIFEHMRDESARDIYLIYCRADLPEIRWRRYEDCIRGVRISHSPRYMLDMDGECGFFAGIGVSMGEFRKSDMRTKMKIVRDHVKERIGPGERLWWIDDDEDHTLPAQVRLFRLLDKKTKKILRAEASLMCPQIFKPSRKRGKYDDAALYLLTRHGVFAPHTRDLFSAGSVAGKERGGDYMIRAVQRIAPLIAAAAARLDGSLFLEYWGVAVPPSPKTRLEMWLSRVDECRPSNPPSQHIDFGELALEVIGPYAENEAASNDDAVGTSAPVEKNDGTDEDRTSPDDA